MADTPSMFPLYINKSNICKHISLVQENRIQISELNWKYTYILLIFENNVLYI